MSYLTSNQWQTVFKRLGKLIKTFNNLEVWQTLTTTTADDIEGIQYLANEIISVYTDRTNEFVELPGGPESLMGNFPDSISGYMATVDSWKASLVSIAEDTINEVCSVTDGTSTGRDALTWLPYALKADSQTVAQSVYQVGGGATQSLSLGTNKGILYLTTGYYDAVIGQTVHEAGIEDDFIIRCVSSTPDVGSRGHERYSISGTRAGNKTSAFPTGAGSGPTLISALGTTVLTDSDFENWVANTPTNWTINEGAATTNIVKETSTIVTGLAAAKFIGTTTHVSVYQAVNLSTRKPYIAGVWYKTASATGTIRLDITSSTGSVIDSVTASPTADNAWHLLVGMVLIEDSEYDSAGYRAMLRVSSLNGTIYFDDFCVIEAQYFDNIGMALWPGTTAPTLGDTVTTSTAGNSGVIQTFFVRIWGIQLPSTSGTATILDSLAE